MLGLNVFCFSLSIALKATLLGRPGNGRVTADKGEPSTLLLDAVYRAPLGLVQASLTVPSPLPCVNGVLSQSSPETLFALEQHCK